MTDAKSASDAKPQVVWCDIPVLDLDRAIRFYGGVLDEVVQKHDFPGGKLGVLPHGGNSVGGCLVVSEQEQPSASGPLLYFNCAGRLEQAVGLVEKLGGKVLQARHAIGQHGFRAVVIDSEGNRIALHSP